MISTILLLALVSPTELDFHIMPPGSSTVLPGIGQVRYYVLKEYLELADLDKELFVLRRSYQDLLDINDTLKLRHLVYADEFRTMESDLKIMSARCMRLQGSWDTCESELAACESTWWPWVVAAAGAAMGAVGVSLAVAASLNIF
jgi:hypothetical protein